MEDRNAKRTDIMFALGEKVGNPFEMWTKKVNRFLKTHHAGITTHDFRKTAATNLYKQTKDIVKVQRMLGHSGIEATRLYIDD